MCSISVEPMPSTMSTPKCALKRSPSSAGSASPADDTRRSATSPRVRQVRRGEHAGEAGRRAVEHGGLDAADAAGPALEGRVGRRPLGHQQHGGAHAQREGQRIAQAVGEEQLGGGEADVVLGQAEHALAVQLAGPVGVGVRMHRALGAAGGAGRVEPEARVVGARARPAWGSGACAARKASNSTSAGCSGATGRDTITLPHLVIRLDQRGRQRRQQRARHQHRLRAASAPACRRSRRR